ncbi:hypothetical protein [Botrimarina colliarenosi]|nr:hypothetical protein [Botrimarina colliarenosi]
MSKKNPLVAILAVILSGIGALSGTAAEAQLREWTNSVNGLWTDATKWSSANVPDTAAESATLKRFGTFAVSIPGGQPLLTIGSLETGFGDITLRPDGVANAAVRVTGDAFIGASSSLRLTDVIGTVLDLQIDGQMRVDPSSEWLIEAGDVTTGSLSIATSSDSSSPTGVTLFDGATAAFGDVTIAEAAGPARSELTLFSGSSVTVDDLAIGAGAAALTAEVNVVASTLLQSPGGKTTIGFAEQAATGRATLALSSGGDATLEAVEVLRTGKLINNNSSLRVKKSLAVVGGEFSERGGATRDFSLLESISVTAGGDVALIGAALVLGDGQTLTLDEGALQTEGGLVVDGGAVVIGASAPSSVTGATTLKPGGSIDLAPQSHVVFASHFVDEGGDFTVPSNARVVFAGDYSGSGVAGGGRVEADDALRPGMSVGVATFGGDLATGKLVIEIDAAGQHDRVEVAGRAELDEQLVVEFVSPEGYAPAAGDAFPLLTAGSITGGFTSLTAPALGEGLAWRVQQTGSSLTLWVVEPGLAGDFNYDGAVNAADYTVWRDAAGSTGALLAADANGDNQVDQADYDAWRAAYGSVAAQSVPEPNAAGLLATSVLAAFGARIRRPKLARSAERL